MKELFVMSECSTPTPHQIALPPYRHATGNTSEKRKTVMKGEYEREVEHSSFTPLVFSASGGMACGTKIFYGRLATLLANKWDNPYSCTLSWLRCRLTFSLLRSAIRCIRAARRLCHQEFPSSPHQIRSWLSSGGQLTI